MAGPFSFGRRSEAQFVTLHHDLQIVYTGAIEVFDFSIIQGARTIEQQILNVTNRVSKTLDSRHIPRDLEGHYDPNKPGSAGDTTPYTEGVNPYALDSDPRHVREKKKHRFYYMQGVFLHVAHREGIVKRHERARRGQNLRSSRFTTQPSAPDGMCRPSLGSEPGPALMAI